ncbi:hypothetical protein RB195_016577 [Necator americanus]|uniref:Uncharacterized protein n=1 Tax=Necator americanus TaxID=51031 RepID=A0ABR1C2P7_NECAM
MIVSFHGFFGFGGRNRRSPTGASAKGTLKIKQFLNNYLRNDRTLLWRNIDSCPFILPSLVSTSTGM